MSCKSAASTVSSCRSSSAAKAEFRSIAVSICAAVQATPSECEKRECSAPWKTKFVTPFCRMWRSR